jgi:hypothetical protein
MARKDPRIEAAEDELIACMRFLRRMPDRERSWLLHSTLRWPAMIRDQGDYPVADEPLPPLSRREIARMEAMFLVPGSHVERAVAVRDRALVACVAAMKVRGDASGFGWDDVWNALGGLLPTGAVDSDGRAKVRKVTSDAMRMRYARALEQLAAIVVPDEPVFG